MPPFDDKRESRGSDSEDALRPEPLPQESEGGDVEELETDDEYAELSPDEMKPFTVAEWQEQFPDFTTEELEEKIPESLRASRMALVLSCVWGTALGAGIAGVLANNQPRSQQARAFFIFFLVLAPLFSCVWYWLFYLRGEQVAQKMKEEASLAGSEPDPPNEELQEGTPAGSEPIHPK